MMMMAWQGRLVKGVGEIQLKPSYSRLVSRKCHFIAWVRVCQWEEADGNAILLMGQTHQNILTLNLTSLNFNYFLIVNFFRYYFFVCTFNTRVSDSLMSVTLNLVLDHGMGSQESTKVSPSGHQRAGLHLKYAPGQTFSTL